MEYRDFNKKLLISFFCIVFSVALLNFLVDPYNIFMKSPLTAHLLKPEAKVQERVTKIIGMKVDNRDISAVFVGTSRTDWALNRDYYKKITGKNAENIAMAGLALEEYEQVVKTVLKIHPEIKDVYFGADFASFSGGEHDAEAAKEEKTKALINSNPKLELSELGTALLSVNTTGNSLWTIVKNLTGIKKRMFASNGLKYVYQNPSIEQEFDATNEKYLKVYKNYSLSQDKLNVLRKIRNLCEDKGVSFHLFVMPTHVRDLELIYSAGKWDDFVNWKKEMAKISPVLDFQVVNEFTAEKIGPNMKNFFETSHATHFMGDRVIDAFVNGESDICEVVTPYNAEKSGKKNLFSLKSYMNNQERNRK